VIPRDRGVTDPHVFHSGAGSAFKKKKNGRSVARTDGLMKGRVSLIEFTLTADTARNSSKAAASSRTSARVSICRLT
jgi:hypothetical protein